MTMFLLKDGLEVASGEINSVLTSANLSSAYGISVSITSDNGRFFAKAAN